MEKVIVMPKVISIPVAVEFLEEDEVIKSVAFGFRLATLGARPSMKPYAPCPATSAPC